MAAAARTCYRVGAFSRRAAYFFAVKPQMNVSKLLSSGSIGLLSLGLLGVFATPACNPLESYSDIPEIAPLRVTRRDSTEAGRVQLALVDVVISWKDGNGDLGVLLGNNDPNDINYFLTIEKRKNNEFVVIKPFSISTTGFNGRFINLNPEGQESTKAFRLRGELTYRINAPGFPVVPPQAIGTINGVPEKLSKGDVLRFQVQIKDRAGNLSNKITTEEVTL